MHHKPYQCGFLAALTTLSIASGITPGIAAAADLLGLYVGGSVGRSTVRDDEILLTSPGTYRYDFDQHHTGWKLLIGVRPLPWLGAEAEYLDFGHPRVNNSAHSLPVVADGEAKGEGVFAVGHLPVPLPMLDFYGKLGVARLHTTVNASNLGHVPCTIVCPAIVWKPGVYRLDTTSTDFAYGAGVQLKLAPVGVRLEYERVSVKSGDPDLLSLGATWTF